MRHSRSESRRLGIPSTRSRPRVWTLSAHRGRRDENSVASAQWKSDFRAEPHIARLVLVGPLVLWDESERPDFVKWEATPTTDLLDGLATLLGSSPTGTDPILRRNYVLEIPAA